MKAKCKLTGKVVNVEPLTKKGDNTPYMYYDDETSVVYYPTELELIDDHEEKAKDMAEEVISMAKEYAKGAVSKGIDNIEKEIELAFIGGIAWFMMDNLLKNVKKS